MCKSDVFLRLKILVLKRKMLCFISNKCVCKNSSCSALLKPNFLVGYSLLITDYIIVYYILFHIIIFIVNPFVNPFDASHQQAGLLAGHLAGVQTVQRAQPRAQPRPQALPVQTFQTTTQAAPRFFPPGNLKLNRFESGFNFDFSSQ